MADKGDDKQFECDLCGYYMRKDETSNNNHRWSKTCVRQQQKLIAANVVDPLKFETEEMQQGRSVCEKAHKEKASKKAQNKKKRKEKTTPKSNDSIKK